MKITKYQTKKHLQVMDLVESDKPLTKEEKLFIIKNYNPMSSHNVGINGIFFTPLPIAELFASSVGDAGGRIIDLCGGIGVLTWALIQHDLYHHIKEVVIVEVETEFVQVGKRILPECTWINGSIFDKDLINGLGIFDLAISNPPYGNVATISKKFANTNWLTYNGPAHLMASEVACRMSRCGGQFIIPAIDTAYNPGTHRYQTSAYYKSFTKKLPGCSINPVTYDIESLSSLWQGAQPKVTIASIDNFDFSQKP